MVYLDTSVAIPLFVREPTSERVEQWFASCTDAIVSSDWLVTEFSSALSIKQRRADITAELAQAAWAEFMSFCGSGLRLIRVSRTAFEDAAHLARDAGSGLRSGDSLHLAMAIEVGANSIATADSRLGNNATKKGLATISF